MSQQVLSAIERRAVWEAHGKRCNYCRIPILFRDLHIDHIIPESLLCDAKRLATLKAEIGLEPDFEVYSYVNLVPSCSRCNLDKGSRQLLPGRLTIEFARSGAALGRISGLIARYDNSESLDRARALLAAAYERRQVNDVQLLGLIRKLHSKEFRIKLGSKVEIIGQDVRYVSRNDYERFRHEYIQDLHLVNSDGDQISISTLDEYEKAREGASTLIRLSI